MKNLNNFNVLELDYSEAKCINGGGPLWDGISWFYQTMGSFWHGVYDGFVGNEPKV